MKIRNNKICFYGGGSWGQALAITLANKGQSSSILVSDQNRMISINNNKLPNFPSIKYPNLIDSFTSVNLLKDYDIIFITTESYRVENSLKKIHKYNPHAKIIITSKGFANSKGKTFPELIIKKYPNQIFGVLTGPTFAHELSKNLPAAALIASKDLNFSKLISEIFFKSCLRLYISEDIIGASIAGAIKNIIAIGSGITEGLKLGENAKAGLITRGIEETQRIILKMGGKSETIFGLAGLGDMILTCGSSSSRNMKYGMTLVKPITKSDDNLVEGIYALKATKYISKMQKIETPIIDSIHDIIYKKKDVKVIIQELFKRPTKKEFSKKAK